MISSFLPVVSAQCICFSELVYAWLFPNVGHLVTTVTLLVLTFIKLDLSQLRLASSSLAIVTTPQHHSRPHCLCYTQSHLLNCPSQHGRLRERGLQEVRFPQLIDFLFIVLIITAQPLQRQEVLRCNCRVRRHGLVRTQARRMYLLRVVQQGFRERLRGSCCCPAC